MNTLVLVVEGKNDSSDYVTVKTFDNISDAAKFASDINNVKDDKKYWKTAVIINPGEKTEIDDANPNV